MTCTCHGGSSTTAATGVVGTRIPTSRTITIAAGQTADLVDTDANRRSILIQNRSAGGIVVAFGQEAPVSGNGPGITIDAGATLSVETTAAVHVLNPTGSSAVVAYVAESD